MHLTDGGIKKLGPRAVTYIEWDDQIIGLGVRVARGGTKAFVLNYRFDGKERRKTLGRASAMGVKKARQMAADDLVKVRSGIDPLEEAARRKCAPTVAEGVAQFFADYVPKRRAIGRMTERTAKEYARQADKHVLPTLGRKRIRDVTKGDVERMLARLPPIMANRVRALVSRLFTLFEHWEYRPQHTNPARGVEQAVEEARDRTLTESELSAIGRSLDSVAGNPGAILAVRLAAITGLRIGEIRNMRWADVDFEGGALVLPRTKTGRRVHTLPSAALALLAEAPRFGACVIPGRDPDTPLDYRSVQRHWTRACEAAGVSGVRLHDLRRTIMTEAAALGVGSHLLRDMVGHKTTAMADRYARRAGAPLTELRERMGATMAAKLAGAGHADVVPLPKADRKRNR